ncbi:ABC transporter permease [Ligilactobacillus animalis]|uniref:ABC transporter permease n=1 Tax=Ligilactobacillus animalis TaxID=1605 RepID=UPI0002194B59|nr:ABC transporter permease [Ligilactobacillus animalis]KRM56831.1 ABC transporter permease [Ligilactobacillus animalis KCTC 3501 = DSM 20602]
MFYAKLAFQNIRKNKQAFVPFLLSMIFLTALNTLMLMVANDPGLAKLQGAGAITQLFGFGSVIVLIFSVVFATYTETILNKQRKNELGLYNVLGMGKRELYKLTFFEKVINLVTTVVLGITSGVIFSRLAYLIIKKLMGVGGEFKFTLNPSILMITILFIAGVYAWLYLINAFNIFKSDPIELLHADQKGEKEPKAKWFLALVGLVSLVWGYWIALTIKSPVSAITNFFIAVLLVIIGTYLIFTAGSIVVLKLLRKNENYYYNVKHFIPVSGMIYRMKQNAVGLASICILSTMVLVTVSTTAGLFFGLNDQVQQMFPRDVMVTSAEPLTKLKQVAKTYAAEEDVKLSDMQYSRASQPLLVTKDANNFKVSDRMYYSVSDVDKSANVVLISLSEYNTLTKDNLSLNKTDDIFMYTTARSYPEKTMVLNGHKYQIKQQVNKLKDTGLLNVSPVDSYIVVMKDQQQIDSLLKEWFDTKKGEAYLAPAYALNFNIDLKDQAKRKAFIRGLSKEFAKTSDKQWYSFQDKDSYRESVKRFDGGFFFLGIILGTAFLLATTLIIYYKQVSEGMDDRERFVILQKVGMDEAEVKRVIHSQIMMVFIFPLAFAMLHVAFAFPLIKKMLVLFGITNWQLFLVVTLAVALIFSILYYIVYQLTARVYYRLVER